MLHFCIFGPCLQFSTINGCQLLIYNSSRKFRRHNNENCAVFCFMSPGGGSEIFFRSNSRVVSVLDSGAEGPGFKPQPRRCRVKVLGKLHTNRASVHQAAKLVADLLRIARVTASLAECNGSLPRVYDSRHLQDDCQERGSAPEPYAR